MRERYGIAHVAFLSRGSPETGFLLYIDDVGVTETGFLLYIDDVGVTERWILGLSSRRRIDRTPTTLDYGPFS